MKAYIDNQDKIIELWFTNKENPDSIIPPRLNGIIDEYRRLKYRICLYHSGTEDLTHLTSELLVNNLKEIATKKANKVIEMER